MTVLIIDSDEKIIRDLKSAFQYKGYTVFTALTVIQAKGIIMRESPHMIILNIELPDFRGFGFLKELKSNIMFINIPIIIVSERNTLEDRIQGLELGADDYIAKPFDLAELLARMSAIIKRTYYSLDANPLTRLPGNLSIIRTIEERIGESKQMAIAYSDLDNFKAYNDAYGFSKGDEIIKHTAKIILSCVHDFGQADDFVGHIGGDDFIMVSTPDHIDAISLNIIKKFDETIPSYYLEEDRERSSITIEDRRGKLKEFPLMSISIAVMTNQFKAIRHIGEVSAITSELKRYAKSFIGSCYVKDRRDKSGIGSALIYGGTGKSGEVPLSSEEEARYREELSVIINQRTVSILFQPIIDLTTDTIIGHEAFCHGPAGSTLENPYVLFRVARRLGLVLELDQIAREKILSVAQKQQKGLLLFLNVWPESLEDPRFQSHDFLTRVGRNPSEIIFEVGGLENQTSFELHQRAITYFNNKGFKMAIDNVGGGQIIGLGVIAEIKPAFVKLDISLMRGIHKDTIKQQTLRALISVFTQLHINIIAEKVELAQELEFLKSAGIKFAQGYLFARPESIKPPAKS